MTSFDDLATRIEELLTDVDRFEPDVRQRVFELLDAVDLLHREALRSLASGLKPDTLTRLRTEPLVAWLFDAYGAGIDEKAAADQALEPIRPYIQSHGGKVSVLSAEGGVVRLQLLGACSGCSASAITLKEGIEEALRENFPGFLAIEVEEDEAPEHPPPGPTLLQIGLPN